MGIEPFLVASTLIGALAQRLVRRLCPQCRRAHVPDTAERGLLQMRAADKRKINLPGTCAACANSGYQGRTGVFELLTVDDQLRTLIHDGVSEERLREHGQKHGMRSIREDGLRWVLDGETSLDEVLRVSRE
jgi:general secretion pathway protein E